MEKLHPGIKKAQILSSVIGNIFGAFFFGIFFGAIFGGVLGTKTGFSFTGFLIGFFLIGGGILALSIAIVIMRYNRFLYEFRKDALYVERGIIFKKYSTIPYTRVQNVDIRRGIMARIFGYSALFIQTAGYSGYGGRGHRAMPEGYIPGVSVEGAEKIRDFVMKKIKGSRGRGGGF